jgi:hypothetical protein
MRENGHDAVMPVIALGRCLNDPNLFGRHFRGASWRAWRVFLAALFAEAIARIPGGQRGRLRRFGRLR